VADANPGRRLALWAEGYLHLDLFGSFLDQSLSRPIGAKNEQYQNRVDAALTG